MPALSDTTAAIDTHRVHRLDQTAQRACIRTVKSEWGICWIVSESRGRLEIAWMDGGTPRRETLRRREIVSIQKLS